MPLNFTNIHGDTLTMAALKKKAAALKKPKAASDSPAEFHKGFRVVGHPPGALEEARSLADAAVAEWGGGNRQRASQGPEQRPASATDL